MIRNERQYKITKCALAELGNAIASFRLDEVASTMGSEAIARAQLQAMETEAEILTEQVQEYDALKSGVSSNLCVASLSELPLVLIRARIAKGWSQKDLADALELKEQQVQRYEAEDYESASFHRLMEVSDVLGLKISETVRMAATDKSLVRSQKDKLFDWSAFPLKEVYKRNWLEDLVGNPFQGSFSEAEANRNILVDHYLSRAFRQPLQAFHKKHSRVETGTDEYSLVAWSCRILRLADKIQAVGEYKKERLTHQWLNELVKLSAVTNGPQLVKPYLNEAGIRLVIESHLPRTYLDGAVLMSDMHGPVIGMTLRYDRLDNFWFVLLHELAHLILHAGNKNYVRFFDDLEVEGDDLEKEADNYASEALLPEAVWSKSVARYVRSNESVNQLAKKLGVGKCVIAGRIRRESEDYTILRECVGNGEVRKQFSEVRFD